MTRTLVALALALGALSGTPTATGGNRDFVAHAAQPVHEDSPGWDCTTMGNHVCGPTNTQGVAAGHYEAGVLVTPWDELVAQRGWTGDRALGA
jgi:hypothetical protein